MTNKAAYVLENSKIEIRSADMPICGDKDVMVKISYCGVCGSDVHFYEYGEPAFPDVYPFVLGHECAGEVVEAGKEVSHLKIGDRVALEPGITCGECEWCKGGKYNLCSSVKFLSAPTYNGAMRTYVSHPANLCFKLPKSVPSMDGALIEPLAVGLNAVVQSGITTGKNAVVLGAGCIGLVTLLSLKAMGVEDVTVVDLFDIRLEKAKELGAAHTVNAKDTDAVEAVLDIYGKCGPDFVFETAGSVHTAAQTIYMVKRGGAIVMVGNTVGQTPFNFQLLVDKEVEIKSVFRYRNIYPIAIEALATGKIDISKIVTRVYPFEQTMKAFEASISDKQSMVKAVIQVSEER